MTSRPDCQPGLTMCGLKRYFKHTQPWIRRLAVMQQTGEPIEERSRQLRAEDARSRPYAGRNAPCPCGSGKKFKTCCLAH